MKLFISMPGNIRRDPKLTSDVQREKHLDSKSGRWLKQLYPDEALDPLNKLANEARQWHYGHSLPWLDEGMRILPSTHYFDYTNQMRDFRHKFEGLAGSHFLARYDEWLAWARQAHNGTFDDTDYPGTLVLRDKFEFRVDLRPVPSGEDFRVNFSEEEMEVIKQDMDEKVQIACEEARKDLWHRLMDPIKNMAEQLRKDKPRIYDTLTGNLMDIVKLIPVLNLTGDDKLNEFREEVLHNLCVVSTDSLRENEGTRKNVAAQAEALINRMKGYCV